jgi:peptidoglycan/LPS O-acetylase OafA/YrhL
MAIPGPASTPHDPRSLEGAILLIGAGAILLIVSLFLEWYQPGVDAWEIFEVWDLVLAVLAIAALVAVAGRLGYGPPRPASWLLAPAVAALVIVLFALLNPPPLAHGIDGDPGSGLWLALVSAVLMAAGAVLSVARISVAITSAGPAGAPEPARRPGGSLFSRSPAAPAAAPGEPIAPADPVRRGEEIPPTDETRRM